VSQAGFRSAENSEFPREKSSISRFRRFRVFAIDFPSRLSALLSLSKGALSR